MVMVGFGEWSLRSLVWSLEVKCLHAFLAGRSFFPILRLRQDMKDVCFII